MILKINDFLSIFAVFISLITFVYNFHTSKPRIKFNFEKYITDNNIDETNKYNLIVKCSIENHSKYPIKILRTKFNSNNCFLNKIHLAHIGFEKFGQQFIISNRTFDFPIKLDSYESCDGHILFESDKLIKIRFINLLTIYTTRGKHYKLLLNHKSRNKGNNRKNKC